MEPEAVSTATGALVAGLVTSLHCAGMCGPMACGLASLQAGEAERQRSAVLYHVGRLVSYALVGALAGWTGRAPLEAVSGTPAMVLPWFLVFVFLFTALGIHASFPRPAFWKRWTARVRLRMARMSAGRGALGVGLVTPLLPCGPLYAMFGIALLSGSALRGVEFMLAFGLGTVPLLWVAQNQFHRLRQVLSPASMGNLRRGMALVAAGIMVWRLWGTLPWTAADPAACPFCQ